MWEVCGCGRVVVCGVGGGGGVWKNVGEVECVEKCGGGVGKIVLGGREVK